MTDSTARKKVPLPPGYVVPRPQQPPPMRRRDSKSVTGVEVTASAEPAPAAPVAVSAPVPARVNSLKAAAEERAAAAYREAMSTISEDEDKTTAFQVPEELLRRSRTGVPGPAFEVEEKSPDSGAITAPPPAEAAAESEPDAEALDLKLGIPGMPRNLDVHSFADDGLEADDASLLADEEHSGEFTRINTAGELEVLAAIAEQQEATKTVVRKRIEAQRKQQVQGASTAVAVLWVVIGTLGAAGAVLASLMARG